MGSSAIVDAYFWCQLLGWNYDIGSVILLSAMPFIIIFGIIAIIFAIAYILDFIDAIRRHK